MRKRKPTLQQCWKHWQGRCLVCDKTGYEVLTVHRVVPGCQGGKYEVGNITCLCANCHARVHKGKIQIGPRVWHSGKGWVWRVEEDGHVRWLSERPPGAFPAREGGES